MNKFVQALKGKQALIREVRRVAPHKAIVVYPDSGENFHVGDISWSGTACDFDYDFNMLAWQEAGAKLVGGCCRTSPENISAIKALLCPG